MARYSDLIKNLSLEDLEKLRLFFSSIPDVISREIITLRVFAEEYNNWAKHNRSAAYSNSVQISLRHLIEYFEEQKSIQSIGFKDVESFLTYLQQKVTKGYRVYFKTLKAAFNKGIDWGYLKENYFLKVRLPKKQQVHPIFINRNQLLIISEKLKCEVIRVIAVSAFYTGMRLNELINLVWRNVDLNARVITVGDERFTTKGRNQRYIPICDELFEILSILYGVELERGKEYPVLTILKTNPPFSTESKRNYVFCKKDGTRYNGNYVSRMFKNACFAAGMEKEIHFHSLRHSYASNLAQRGVSLYTIKELLGHSSITTTEIYSHLNIDTLREAVEKLNINYSPALPPAKSLLPSRDLFETKIYKINSGEK